MTLIKQKNNGIDCSTNFEMFQPQKVERNGRKWPFLSHLEELTKRLRWQNGPFGSKKRISRLWWTGQAKNSLFKTAQRTLILPDCNPSFSIALQRCMFHANRTSGTWKKNLGPLIYIFILYTLIGSTARSENHGFFKFWSLDLENGLGWTSWTSWNGPGTKFLGFLTHSYDITRIQIIQNPDLWVNHFSNGEILN